MVVDAAHRLSIDQYHQMIEAGVLDEDDRVELIEGVIVDMSPRSPEHERVVKALTKLFARGLDLDRFDLGITAPLTIGQSEPEPDLTVVEIGTPAPHHPATAHLVIEVAFSSQRRDLVIKPPVYASAGVPDYWVVDLEGGCIVAHREPASDGYRHVERVRSGDLRALGVSVDVQALLTP